MVDIYCEVGGDWKVDQFGGIQEATGWDEASQSIQRVLYTNPAEIAPDGTFLGPDYPWEPDFGLGLRRVVGRLESEELQKVITEKCTQACVQNIAVAKNPPPIIQFLLDVHVLSIYIFVTLANNTPGVIAMEYTE